MAKTKFKRIKLRPVDKVDRRHDARVSRAEFSSMCIDIVQRKAHPQKQRNNDEACRRLWQHATADLKTATKGALRAMAQRILDPIMNEEIQASHIPFVHKDEEKWHLAASISLKKPSTWQVKQIVARTVDKDGQVMYEVEWENTLEPVAYLPQRLVKTFENRMRLLTESAYIEAEAVEDNEM